MISKEAQPTASTRRSQKPQKKALAILLLTFIAIALEASSYGIRQQLPCNRTNNTLPKPHGE